MMATSCTLLVDLAELSGGSAPPDGGLDGRADGGLTSDLDGTTGGEAGGDATVGDRADADAGADAAVQEEAGLRKNSCGALLFGTPVPIFNGDLELGCASGYTGYQATITESTSVPSNGALACKVCFVDGINGFLMSATVSRNILPGESYEAVACVRAVPGDDSGVRVFAELTDLNIGKTGIPSTMGDGYVPVRVGWDVPEARSKLTVSVRSYSVSGACFLVDDFSLSLVREAGAP